MSTATTRRVAVVGSGVAGLTAAWVASRTAHVTLFEADDRLGGHADTHRVATPDGELAIDTGFIVHNRRTYPTLLRLFAELGIATQPSEMSLSVSDAGTGVEYAGALGARGLFAQRSSLRSRDALADAARDPPLPPPGEGRCSPTSRVRIAPTAPRSDQTLRDFLATAASPPASSGTSWSRWWRPSGRATRRRPSTTPPATSSPSSSTTGCSASSARRSGAPSPAARRTYVAAVADRPAGDPAGAPR